MRELDRFNHEPWSSPYLQGIIDAPFLNITPGTRSGIIYDDALQELCGALASVEQPLIDIIDEQRRAEEERASAKILRSVQKALKEAVLSLPAEEYDWFDLHVQSQQRLAKSRAGQPEILGDIPSAVPVAKARTSVQKQFFEYAGPLFSVRIIPQSCVIPVGATKTFRALARDRNQKLVEENLAFLWEILDGEGKLESSGSEIAVFTASKNPGLIRIMVTATQGEITCCGEAIITATESLVTEDTKTPTLHQGLPGYTYKKAPGELWRSYYNEEQNVIVINNGHRDFVFSSKKQSPQNTLHCPPVCQGIGAQEFQRHSSC